MATKFLRRIVRTPVLDGGEPSRVRGSCVVAVLASLLWLAVCQGQSAGVELVIQNNACTVRVDPATLAVSLQSGDHPALVVSAPQTNLGRVANLERQTTRAAWALPERKLSVTLALEGRRLLAHLLATEAGSFTFPVLSETAAVKGWILPLFEGVYAPCGDARWASFLTNRGELNTTADLPLPFLGLDCGKFTVTCILTNPFNNQLEF